MNKIEHIGIAVKKLDEAVKVYSKLFNQSPYKTEVVEGEHVATSFFQLGESKIELLEATNSNSAIYKFIEKHGEGMHHIAFDVDDIYKEITRLKNEGFVILNDQPKKGADNKLVCFVHPKSANGVLIELCQDIR